MKDLTASTGNHDDIDVIVDALLKNPESADDIKTLLRQKILAPRKVRVLKAKVERAKVIEQDEFWENFPV